MRSAPRACVVLVFLGTLLLQAAWVLAVPPYRGMDEFDHAYRAESVAAGHWVAQPASGRDDERVGRGDLVRVRADTARAGYQVCHTYAYITEADCRPARSFEDGTVLVASGAARYDPVYYWLVGTAARGLDPVPGLYVMRLLNAGVCALLVALAAWGTTVWSRRAWPLLGVLLACTPIAMYTGSTPAPNGPEMFAGLALWSLLLGLRTTEPGDAREGRLLRAALLPAVVLVVVRTLGPLWLVLLVLAVAAALGRSRVRSVLRANGPLMRVEGAVLAVATLAAVGWSRDQGANSLARVVDQHRPDAFLKSLQMLRLWVFQTVGAFPDKFDLAPQVVNATALLLIGGLLAWALVRGDARPRLVLAAVVLTSFALPFAITVRTYAQVGPVWQARYTWPFACGALMLAGQVLDRRDARLSPRALTALVVVSFVLVQLPGPLSVLFDESRTSPWAGSSSWLLPFPGAVAAAVTCALAAWLAALLLAHAAIPPDPSTRRPVDVPAATEVPA